MGILDSYIREARKPRIGKKKIFVTDKWPEDGQFWDRDLVQYNDSRKIERFAKYTKLKNGKWSKRQVLGDSIRQEISLAEIEWLEFERIVTSSK
jgi:hypothetical protein